MEDKHQKKKKGKKMGQMEMKKHLRRKGEGLTQLEECLFYREQYGSEV